MLYDDPNDFELTPPPPIKDLVELGDVGEFFATFIDFLYTNLVKQGIEEEQASQTVSKITCQLSSAFAGETFYVAKQPAVFARQMAMYIDLKRMPYYDVDKKYSVSRGYSLAVKKQIDDKRMYRNQLRLFD